MGNDRRGPTLERWRLTRAQWRRLFKRRGLALRDRGAGNFEVECYRGLVLKASYWRWPDRDMAGNAIDFYTKVLGMSFAESAEPVKSLRRHFGQIYDGNLDRNT